MIAVVPLAGTWIETPGSGGAARLSGVVPLAGTWIETHVGISSTADVQVVPIAGTWIETLNPGNNCIISPSFTLRERGLKP